MWTPRELVKIKSKMSLKMVKLFPEQSKLSRNGQKYSLTEKWFAIICNQKKVKNDQLTVKAGKKWL